MKYDAVAFLEELFNPTGMREREALAVSRADTDLQVDHLTGDWRVDWEERAAVLEYDGRHPRERAEALALTEILEKMRRAGI
jgi:hypothetical protein